MKVLILSKYDQNGASSRYRFYNYREYFTKKNIEIVFKPLLSETYIKNLYSRKRTALLIDQVKGIVMRFVFLLTIRKKYDLIIIEKELFPSIPYFIEAFLLMGKPYSLDFDDYIAADYKLKPLKRFFFESKIDKLSQKAKFVTVGNHWYFEEIKSQNLVYLPTVINLQSYTKVKDQYNDNLIEIVWIGSKTTASYLYLIASTLRLLSVKYPIKLKVIGAEIKLEGVPLSCIPWSENTEVDEIVDSDVGIMPLVDDLWSRGKCGFKLIQYMACGLPVVGSALPANREIIDHNINGYIAENCDEWYIYLEKLINSEFLRKNLGSQARKKIEDKYSYQVWGDIYTSLILDAKS